MSGNPRLMPRGASTRSQAPNPNPNQPTIMKSTLKALLVAAFAVSLATSVSAAPPGSGKGGILGPGAHKAGTQEEIQKLKKGDHYALVCMECESVTVKEVADDKEAEALCHDGGTVHCDSCEKKYTITHSGTPGKGTTSKKVSYVNADGKPCMSVVPVKQ